jgi:hypothetical protein
LPMPFIESSLTFLVCAEWRSWCSSMLLLPGAGMEWQERSACDIGGNSRIWLSQPALLHACELNRVPLLSRAHAPRAPKQAVWACSIKAETVLMMKRVPAITEPRGTCFSAKTADRRPHVRPSMPSESSSQ